MTRRGSRRSACALVVGLALGVLPTTAVVAASGGAYGDLGRAAGGPSALARPEAAAHKSKTRIVLHKEPYKATLWRIDVRLLRNGDPVAHATLDLQVKLDGSWNSIKRKKPTDRNGWASWHTTPRFPVAALEYPFRVHYAGDSSTAAANSRTFRYGDRRQPLTPLAP